MGHPRRPRPKLLHKKLLAIREFLNITQADMANKLEGEILAHSRRQYQIHPGRISEYEKKERVPNLYVLIAYIHFGQVHMESVADDEVTIDNFRKRLGKEFDHVTLSRPTKHKRNSN